MEFLTHALVIPIIFPVLAGLICLVVPSRMEKICGYMAFFAGIIALIMAWSVFKLDSAVLDYGRWIQLKADPLSKFAVLAISAFGLLIALYSIGYMKGKNKLNEYYAYLLWTVGISCGAVLANDFMLLLCFWGFLGLTLYLMIGLGGPGASTAAKKSFIIIGGSDSILILGIAIIWKIAGTTRMDAAPLAFSGELSYIAFISLLIAAFAKAGVMPFHTWVPDCGEKAPASVSAFLPASLDKFLGIYFLFRITNGIFQMSATMNEIIMLLGAGTIIFAVMMALIQHDMKKLLSYHAVSQVGYMVLGIGTANPIGMAGGLFHLLNNAVYKACLFLGAGAVEQKVQTTDLNRIGGLAKAMPITFAACVVASLSISGIPPLNGFASKWMIYQGIIEAGKSAGGYLWISCLAASMLGSALTLASFVKVLHATFLCKKSPKIAAKNIRETGVSMWLPMVILAITCIVFGVFAYRLPLRYLVFPIFSEVGFTGVWWAGPATAMLLAGLAIGLVLYLLGTTRKARACPTYIGGEIIDEAYISGEAKGKSRDVEVTGVDFYETVQNLQPFKLAYRIAELKLFDIYDMGVKFIFSVSKVLQVFHTGVLTNYIVWYILGLIILLFMVR